MAKTKSQKWDGEVLTTVEYDQWFVQQSLDIQDRLIALQLELRDKGPTMGMEGSKVLKGNHPIPLRELRIKTPAIRVLYTFDHERNAILLFGGDKTNRYDEWYGPAIKSAARSYESYTHRTLTPQRGGRR